MCKIGCTTPEIGFVRFLKSSAYSTSIKSKKGCLRIGVFLRTRIDCIIVNHQTGTYLASKVELCRKLLVKSNQRCHCVRLHTVTLPLQGVSFVVHFLRNMSKLCGFCWFAVNALCVGIQLFHFKCIKLSLWFRIRNAANVRILNKRRKYPSVWFEQILHNGGSR